MFRFHFSPLCRGCEHQPSFISHLCSSHPPSNVYRTLPQKLCVIVKVNILRYQGEFFSPNAERQSEKKKKLSRQFCRDGERRYGPTNQVPSPLHDLWQGLEWRVNSLAVELRAGWRMRHSEVEMGLESRADLIWNVQVEINLFLEAMSAFQLESLTFGLHGMYSWSSKNMNDCQIFLSATAFSRKLIRPRFQSSFSFGKHFFGEKSRKKEEEVNSRILHTI